MVLYIYFFFQAEDGIRDYKVTGVQTCALPICLVRGERLSQACQSGLDRVSEVVVRTADQLGRDELEQSRQLGRPVPRPGAMLIRADPHLLPFPTPEIRTSTDLEIRRSTDGIVLRCGQAPSMGSNLNPR